MLAQMLSGFIGRHGVLPGTLAPPENWHITVRFLGPVDQSTVDRLLFSLDQEALGGPFPIMLTGFGAFPREDNSSVLWVGVESQPLLDLAARIEDLVTSIGISPEERPYRPHLTLSRIRPPLDVGPIVGSEWGRLRFFAANIVLFRSVPVVGGDADVITGKGRGSGSANRPGVRYQVVDRFAL